MISSTKKELGKHYTYFHAFLTAIGEIENIKVYHDDGSEEMKKMCEFGITLDERIGDGFYFAKSVNMIEKYYQILNPYLNQLIQK